MQQIRMEMIHGPTGPSVLVLKHEARLHWIITAGVNSSEIKKAKFSNTIVAWMKIDNSCIFHPPFKRLSPSPTFHLAPMNSAF